MADTEARWYCVNAIGQATLCSDRRDAEHEAAMADKAWPVRAPHRAVQLGDVGALVAERDSLLRDWVAEQGQRTAAVDRAERAELERDRLRADVRELVECLAESTEDTGECLTHHLQAYGETYRPQRAADYRAQIVKVRALLAKHHPPQALAARSTP